MRLSQETQQYFTIWICSENLSKKVVILLCKPHYYYFFFESDMVNFSIASIYYWLFNFEMIQCSFLYKLLVLRLLKQISLWAHSPPPKFIQAMFLSGKKKISSLAMEFDWIPLNVVLIWLPFIFSAQNNTKIFFFILILFQIFLFEINLMSHRFVSKYCIYIKDLIKVVIGYLMF